MTGWKPVLRSAAAAVRPVALQTVSVDEAPATEDIVRIPEAELHGIRAHCIAALGAAPLADEPRYMLALLDFAGGSPEQSRELLVQLASLRRRNADSLYQVGSAAAVGQMWDLARSAWQRTLQLRPEYTAKVLNRIADTSRLVPHQVVPSTPAALAQAARHNLQHAQPDPLLIEQAVEVLSRDLQRPDDPSVDALEARAARIATLQLLADIETHRGNHAAAAEQLGQIVRLTPTDPNALYAHAAALAANGEKQPAREQARAGRRLAPDDPRFDQLLDNLTP